jgi:dTMP kinase
MKIVCLEGCSGTGKTTQCHLLNNFYETLGLRHIVVVEKNYEPFKSVVEKWRKEKGPNIPFTEEDVRNFAKARTETFMNNFSNLENKIDLILIDRYFYTSAIYQRNCELKPEEILQINIEYGAPIPDLTFLFDCDPYVCFERAKKRNLITGYKPLFSTSPEKISEIREQYLKLMSRRKEVKIIDSSRPVSKISQDLIVDINFLLFE